MKWNGFANLPSQQELRCVCLILSGHVRTMYICKYIISTVNTYIHTISFLETLWCLGPPMFLQWWMFFVLRIAAKQSDVVIVDSCGQYGIWVGSRLQLCTLQGTDRFPTWLKHTLGGDMLVPKRVNPNWCHCRVKAWCFFQLAHVVASWKRNNIPFMFI